MKKAFFSVVIIFFTGVVISGCIKNTPYVPTSNPSMTASIGNYTFVAGTVVTSVADTQAQDSASTLVITGKSSDKEHPFDYIKLSVNKFKYQTRVFSIVQSQASAEYYHNGVHSYAQGAFGGGGVVTITTITENTMTGYFSFNTKDTVNVRNGAFMINRP